MGLSAGLLPATLLGLSVAAAPAGATSPRLASGDWPNGEALGAIEGRRITFDSLSPFTPKALYDPAGAPVEKTTARGTLFLPSGRHAPRSLPAVVLLHGASGVMYARELTYGRQLAAMGVAALVVDAFGARRDKASGFVNRLLNITETMLVTDAYAALGHLKGIEAVDPQRVVMMGFSYGGMASMYAMNAKFARRVTERLGIGDLRFAGHVAYYGPCIARFSEPKTTGAPLLFLYGTGDELIRPERCREIAGDLREGGSRVRLVAFQGAVHQWDGPRSRMRIGRILAGCRFRVEPDGTVRDRRTLMPMSGPILRRVILGLCVDDKRYLIGRDAKVRARSNRITGRFLADLFQRGE